MIAFYDFKLALTHHQHLTHKMDYPPRVTQEAVSSNEVPTLGSSISVKRSASYPESDPEASHKPTTTKDVNGQNENYQQQVKAASTELLNDDRVRSASKARRSLQNVLMETERRLREQRRDSLHKKVSK